MRPLAMLPEMLLLAGALVCLLGGSFTPRRRQWRLRVVAALALLGSAVAAVVGGASGPAFEGSFVVDGATTAARVVVAGATLLVLLLAGDEVAGDDRESETYCLVLLAATGTLVLAGAADLLVLAVGFLLASIPLYGLVGLRRTARGAEAALKAYLVGALFGILLLLGVTLLYGVGGTSSYPQLAGALAGAPLVPLAAGVVLVVAGVAFEAGAVPAHFWVPDAAQGATGLAAAFVTTVPKVGAVLAAFRLVEALPDVLAWGVLVAVLAVASMTLGNLAAFAQDDPRRLLGWSTVSQVGYLLVPVAVAGVSDLALPSLLVYLAGYAVTNVAAFAVTTALPDVRDLSGYAGLVRVRPGLAVALVVALLGLVGTPPTAVFVGKLTTATAAWDGGMAWLVVVVLVNTLASLFYYLRWVAPALRRTEPAAGLASVRPWSAWTAGVAAAVSVLLGVAAGPLFAALDVLPPG
ncbi:NADH-quinone oxidoreductase subunit N [Phycicoccus flavus]|uniref:NADH-quinone oxidoreductase subunit N n=1 Tax=Phycicoccus flavus TaxID=2502783 RepID=A0A8T6QZV5_9MICO|nr:NADH-quinone oxidoreductase subunit N [Phycicoccus flavus]NHA67659.1 NADH-quinone oxidoreductase subunit N [Phycicoccus flavus]